VAIPRSEGAVTLFAEQGDQESADGGIVLDDEDALAAGAGSLSG
jgi:hypothetical protein